MSSIALYVTIPEITNTRRLLVNHALAQSYVPTIKYRNRVIDLGNGVDTNAQLTYPATGKVHFLLSY